MEVITLEGVCYFALILIMVAIAICFVRMVIGPDMSDRILALDLTANLVISFIAVYSLYKHEAVYVDVILALALIVFLTTVAFSNLMQWQSFREKLSLKKR